ncbi:Pregnancy zone protein-like 3 [Homarus americanus]|uniref:Pregnancy zone protein-like 3 n=1 Tax=Homarus americanus TaxID=6706 RepID=A0A8J5JCY4_HOMAM|nr:Pregnancy zone protein-like 3 [Homarus americanus]
MNAPRDDIHFRRYFSPTNSSLTIRAPDGKLMCSPEAIQEHVLYVAYSRVNTTRSDITIQVANERPLTDPHLLAPLPPLPPHYQRGEFKLSIFLPPTASPIVKVLVWCIREDGEVVSDTRELEVEKCLVNRVNLTLTADVARPGAVAMVDLVSPPYSLCSLGVVDRSVELLAPQRNTLTVDKVFEVVRPYTITDTLNHEELDDLY